jgi:hypothetical protein
MQRALNGGLCCALQIITHWMSLFKAGTMSNDGAVDALRHLINPMFTWALTHGQQDVFTPEIIASLVADVFQNSETRAMNEQLQVEVIQLCTVILQHAHALFADYNKELIQYVW